MLTLFANSGDGGECVTTELNQSSALFSIMLLLTRTSLSSTPLINPDFSFFFSEASRGLTWRLSESVEVSCEGKVGSDCWAFN